MPGVITNKGGVSLPNLTMIGRPMGPDLQLKCDRTQLETFSDVDAIAGIITADSSITEVLNIVSYLISTGSGTRNFTNLVDTGNSVHKPDPAAGGAPTSGGIDPTTGYYADMDAAPMVLADTDPFLYRTTGAANVPTTPIIDIDNFTPSDQAAAGSIFIPVSIIKRRGGRATVAADDPDLFEVTTTTRTIPAVTPGPAATPLLSDCVKQMILILMQTRDIFGPKGWTNLFTKVKGGGGSSKKHTHRRHRRRYSSKQY